MKAEDAHLEICELFQSISGEISIGRLAFFVRLGGCNLDCTYCFGVKPGRRIPRIVLSKHQNKKITEVQKGDKLLTLDKNHNLVETTVKNVIKRKVLEWYEITINNKIYFVTPEHPFFTTKGIKRTDQLKVGDQIYNIKSNEKISFRMENYNPMFNGDVVKRSTDNTDYKKLGISVSKTIRKKQQEGTYISPWHKLSDEDKIRLRGLASERMVGENNPNYIKNYTYRNYVTLKELCKKDKINICKDCGKKDKLVVHHIDNNKENDNLENLSTICHSCHNSIHKRGYSFWKNDNRKDNKKMSEERISVMYDVLALVHNGAEVQKIKRIDVNDKKYKYDYYKPKPLTVYNLSCQPYNTYLLDYMWVHNCDSKYSHDKGIKMTVGEIVEQAQHFPTLIITGGEPLLQKENVDKLIKAIKKIRPSIRIEIETNGTIKPTRMPNLSGVVFNVSPKLKNSKNEYKKRIKDTTLNWFSQYGANFKFVVNSKDDMDEIALLVSNIGIKKENVFIMPEGKTRDVQWSKTLKVIEYAKQYGFNFTPRFHILLWGEERGK